MTNPWRNDPDPPLTLWSLPLSYRPLDKVHSPESRGYLRRPLTSYISSGPVPVHGILVFDPDLSFFGGGDGWNSVTG